ncbi:hypothetical protein [Microcoleus sp. F4-D5]|uniref:hypothetical protein n=1 Tax=Microcoleus sp. F4-D5 TaxID=2818760 RepID=UPI002FCF5C7F
MHQIKYSNGYRGLRYLRHLANYDNRVSPAIVKEDYVPLPGSIELAIASLVISGLGNMLSMQQNA